MKNKILFLVVIILFTVFLCIKKVNIPKKLVKETYVNVLINNSINRLTLNDYLFGVVASEMPALFPTEALKAQAIASRTFTIKKLQQNSDYVFKGYLYDQGYIDNDSLKEKWKDKYDEYSKLINKSIIETNNLIITYNKVPIKAYYFSMSNGSTEDASLVFQENEPYLQAIDSSNEENEKNYIYEIVLTKNDFCLKLSLECKNKILIDNINYSNTGRVNSISVNNVVFKGTDFRKKLSLRSTDFDIFITDKVIIKTKGYGHGVGMSQYGAKQMAINGANYEEIIKHYYKGVEIEKFNE